MTDRISAPLDAGVGLDLPKSRDPGHENLQWFELDSDDEFDDPDVPEFDPLPTERHRTIPSSA